MKPSRFRLLHCPASSFSVLSAPWEAAGENDFLRPPASVPAVLGGMPVDKVSGVRGGNKK